MIEVTGDGRGHMTIRGERQDLAGMGNRLRFELALDQSYVGATLRQLDDLIARFPVLGRARRPA